MAARRTSIGCAPPSRPADRALCWIAPARAPRFSAAGGGGGGGGGNECPPGAGGEGGPAGAFEAISFPRAGPLNRPPRRGAALRRGEGGAGGSDARRPPAGDRERRAAGALRGRARRGETG